MWRRNCPVCRQPLEKKLPTETIPCSCGKYVWLQLGGQLSDGHAVEQIEVVERAAIDVGGLVLP
jgi:hypothetical protein